MNFGELNKKAHKIYQELPIGKATTDEDTRFLEWFCNMYHTRSFNLEAQYFYCDKTDGQYGGKNLFMRGKCNGTFDPQKMISLANFRKDPSKNRKGIVLERTKQAMKDCISETHKSVRDYLMETMTVCAICKVDLHTLKTSDVELDHCGDMEYYDLVQGFLKTNPKFELVDLKPNWGLADNQAKDDWWKYHFDNAQYQLLCQPCNGSKNKK